MLNQYNLLRHEMLYSQVMKQFKNYKLNTVFILSLEFLEHGYCEFGGVGTPCISIININSTSYEILCLINNKHDILFDRWRRACGGVV